MKVKKDKNKASKIKNLILNFDLKSTYPHVSCSFLIKNTVNFCLRRSIV